MIANARAKLAVFEQVEHVVGDFQAVELSGAYDAVLSSLALHHLNTDDNKRALYARTHLQRVEPWRRVFKDQGGTNYDGRGWHARVIVRTSLEQGWQLATCSQAGSSIERVRVANSIRIRYGGQPARSGFAWTRE
jgi:hypothetical protein